MVIKLCTEDDMTQVGQIDFTQQVSGLIENGQQVRLATAEGMHERTQFHVGMHGHVVPVDDAVERHQGEHGAVGVVRDELSFACQSHAIDAVRLKDNDGEIGADADNHQRDEQLIAARQFSNEEDASERRMHHAGHHRCHAQHGKVVLWDIDADAFTVPHAGEKESSERPQKQ